MALLNNSYKVLTLNEWVPFFGRFGLGRWSNVKWVLIRLLLLDVGVEKAESVDICKGDKPGGDMGEMLKDREGELRPKVLPGGELNPLKARPESELEEELRSWR